MARSENKRWRVATKGLGDPLESREYTYVGEVILGQHRVGWVTRVVIFEHNVLLSLAALNDLFGASLELAADLVDEGDNERSNEGEDEDGQLLLELLDDLGQDGNLLKSGRDTLHDFIVELDGWHYLLEDILDVDGELLGLTGRDGSVLHLSLSCIGLELVDALTLVLVAKDAVRDLVEKISEHAGVCLASLLEGALKLVNLVLGQLIGDCISLARCCRECNEKTNLRQ